MNCPPNINMTSFLFFGGQWLCGLTSITPSHTKTAMAPSGVGASA